LIRDLGLLHFPQSKKLKKPAKILMAQLLKEEKLKLVYLIHKTNNKNCFEIYDSKTKRWHYFFVVIISDMDVIFTPNNKTLLTDLIHFRCKFPTSRASYYWFVYANVWSPSIILRSLCECLFFWQNHREIQSLSVFF